MYLDQDSQVISQLADRLCSIILVNIKLGTVQKQKEKTSIYK